MPNLARIAHVATKSRRLVAMRAQRSRRWLIEECDEITWSALRARPAPTILPLPRTNGGRLVMVGGVGILLVLTLVWYVSGQTDDKGVVTYPHASLINPIFGGLGALLLIYAAIRQVQIANDRHEAQTKADLQRRITESYSKAIEQLGSEKLEMRLGGIYALERISRESPQDYWMVMENLTAFVRECTRRTKTEQKVRPLDHQRLAERAYLLWKDAGCLEGRSDLFWAEAIDWETNPPPATDVAAALTVINRRSADNRAREVKDGRCLDLQQAVLPRAILFRGTSGSPDFSEAYLERAQLRAHLENADLRKAHLEHAELCFARLEGANLFAAHLEDANLFAAHLEDANLFAAHLERANLDGAFFEGANLVWAELKGAYFGSAHLKGAYLGFAQIKGADLRGVEGLTQDQVDQTSGDAATQLPEGLTRPKHWGPPEDGGAAPAN
jgi:uncharacterized protein YjbI with pentapeptide repeats